MASARWDALGSRSLRGHRNGPEDDDVTQSPHGLQAAVGTLQRSAGNQAVAQLVGSPLPTGVRAEMEHLFGHPFSDVRLHRSGAAERRGTVAFTSGPDIELALKEPAPDTHRGRRVLAHELAHVVQQSGIARSAGPAEQVPKLADDALESQAAEAGERAAAGEPMDDLRLGRAGTGTRVAQHFEEEEHKKIGDEATGGRRVELAPGYTVSYGEMVALSGDHFESIDQMRELAKNPGPGAGTREEIEYVRVVEVNDETSRKGSFSEEARNAAEKRYYQLAANNPTHFQAPGRGDADRSVGDRAKDVEVESRLVSMFPLQVEDVLVPQNAVAAYHLNHTRAIAEAVSAGQSKTGIDQALATEAFSNHFLTDSFSSGHVRDPRAEAPSSTGTRACRCSVTTSPATLGNSSQRGSRRREGSKECSRKRGSTLATCRTTGPARMRRSTTP